MTTTRRPLHGPDLARHTARCPECRALRSHLLRQLLPGFDPRESGCAACQSDLAAYIDLALDEGARNAVEAYPQVWWHLWTCVDCALSFAQTAALAAAERAGELLPLPVAEGARGTRVIGRLVITGPAVARIIQSSALLGVAYGGGDELVLDEEESGGYSFQLSVQREQGGTWALQVSVDPPVVGHAVITVGTSTYRAAFDGQGLALVLGLADALFRDSQPAITVSIEAQ